jgi:UDP-galactopyranose mutase
MNEMLVVGAGFSGAVLARELAEAGFTVRVIDARHHVGGNCHTARDAETGVMEHVYGPHIFHTSNADVWRYVQRFGDWVPFVNRVKANTGDGIFSLPINLHTINQFFKKTFNPAEARAFIQSISDKRIMTPTNFEDQALKFIGRDLYEAFFKGYTIKQWGCDPCDLPAEILKRLPVRFTYNDNYYDSLFQAIPRDGYTQIIDNILAHPKIHISLETPWHASLQQDYGHVFFSGALDQFFDYCEGRLGYRSLHWQRERHEGDFQGNAVINHTSMNVPWTRVLEHTHFSPWETHEKTLIAREFSVETGANDIPYYPKRLGADTRIVQRYIHCAQKHGGVSFIGRLGTYRYLDMHQVIAETLEFSRTWLEAKSNRQALPVFSGLPL